VVVLDDLSNDASYAGIESLPLPLTLVRNPIYSGYGASANRGAAGSRADYLLFVNTDARLFQDTVERCVDFMNGASGTGVAICGAQLVDDADVVSRSCARFPRARDFVGKSFGLEKLLHLSGMFMTEWDHLDTRDVDHVMGACVLIRRSVFAEVGGFDERFFVYLEDLDLSLRAAERGWRTVYLAEAQAYHRGGTTSRQVPSTSLFFSLRSRIQYAYKHFGWWPATAVLGSTLTVEPLTRVVLAATRGSLADAADTLSATARLAKDLPSTFRADAARGTNESRLERHSKSGTVTTALTAVNCPVCRQPPDGQRILFWKQEVCFRRCACGFEMVNPRPDARWLEGRYHDYGARYFSDPRKLARDFRPGAVSPARIQLLSSLAWRESHLLDVGCSTGAFVAWAEQQEFEAEGVDISRPSIDYGRKVRGLKLHCADFSAQPSPLPAGSFDLVTIWETLEHMPEPGTTLDAAIRVLKDGGRLAISVPNQESLTHRALGRRYRYVGVDHVNYFNPSTLTRLLEGHGLRIERRFTRQWNPIVLLQDLRYGGLPSLEDQHRDGSATETIKTARNLGPLRVLHRFAEAGLARAGWADIIYVLARRT
jgi:hypothetical protein